MKLTRKQIETMERLFGVLDEEGISLDLYPVESDGVGCDFEAQVELGPCCLGNTSIEALCLAAEGYFAEGDTLPPLCSSELIE